MAASCGYASMQQHLLLGDPAIGRHFSMLSAALESIEGRSEALAHQLASTHAELATCKTRCAWMALH